MSKTELGDEFDLKMSLRRSTLGPLPAITGSCEGASLTFNRLIDQVVYRLYGLTDEEIAVVEGEAWG